MVFQFVNGQDSLKDGIWPLKQVLSVILPAMASDEVCKRTSTSTMMSPSPPSWRPAGKGPQQRGQRPHPGCSACSTTGSPPALRRICVCVPSGASLPQTCRLGIRGGYPRNPRGGQSSRRAARRGGQPAPRRTGHAGPWGPGASRHRHHQWTCAGSTPTNDLIRGTGESGLCTIRRGSPAPHRGSKLRSGSWARPVDARELQRGAAHDPGPDWLDLMDVHHTRTGARTMENVIFNLCETPRPPPWNTPASGGMWPSDSWPTWKPTTQMN